VEIRYSDLIRSKLKPVKVLFLCISSAMKSIMNKLVLILRILVKLCDVFMMFNDTPDTGTYHNLHVSN